MVVRRKLAWVDGDTEPKEETWNGVKKSKSRSWSKKLGLLKVWRR